MKRLKPDERVRIVRELLTWLMIRWIRHYGEWNAVALANDLERELKENANLRSTCLIGVNLQGTNL